MTELISNLEAMLARGTDNAMLRFGLGKAHLDAGQCDAAARHLERAVELQPDYSAAWKLLGRAQALAGQPEVAARTYARGIEVAEARGDIQAAKEMRIFLKRLSKPTG